MITPKSGYSFNLLPALFFLLTSLPVFPSGNLLYTPKQANLVEEQWRWHVYDLPKDHFIYCGKELSDRTLLFVTDRGLLYYDGYETSLKSFPEVYQGIQTFDIWVAEDNWIYLSTSIGLVACRDNEWNKLLSYQQYYPQAHPQFAQSKDGLLVAATQGGIYYLENGEFELITIHAGGFCSITESGDYLFLAGSQKNRVYKADFTLEGLSQPESWEQHDFKPAMPTSLFLFNGNEDGEVYSLNFRVDSGIYRYSPETKRWHHLEAQNKPNEQSLFSAISSGSGSMIVSSKLSTYIFDGDQWKELDRSIFKQPINAIFSFKRANGNIILGGRGDRILEIDLSNAQWETYEGLHFQCEDFDNRSWFLSKSGSIISKNSRSHHWQTHVENVIDGALTAFCDADGIIWVAGSHENKAAVCYYDGFKWERNIHPSLGDRISHLSAIQLKDGRILFGSGEELPSERDGIIVYSKSEKGYSTETYGKPIVPERIAGLVETEKGELWAGGFNIYQLDPTFKKAFSEQTDINVEWVDHIQKAPDGNLYAALWEKGLFHYDGVKWSAVKTHLQASTNRLISNMLYDRTNNGSLWVATDLGLSLVTQNDSLDQIESRELGIIREEGTLAQSKDGSIWINKTNRAWYFSDAKTRENATHIFKSVRYNPKSEVPRVRLQSFDKTLTEPANVHFRWEGIDKWSITPREQLRYSYQVNNQEWTPYTNKTEILLLNHPPGKHTFTVRVKDKDGNVSELDEKVAFVVYPPVWKRPWFIISVLLVVGLISLLLTLLVRQRIAHLLQLDELKLQFFTNMSHELRTPLMLIIGPLETLLEKLPKDFDQTQAKIAHRNSKKMLHLVDQILEFRKIEFAGLESNVIQHDVVKDIKDAVTLHRPLAEEKTIDLIATFSEEHFEASYDSGKLDRILSNLISNAIKYTKPNGTILVKSRIEKTVEGKLFLQLSIEDDGVGISKDKLRHIFEPFYRVGGDSGRRARGVGLGLSLVKNLLDSIDGSIQVVSPVRIENGENKGARFEVTMPLLPSKPEDHKLSIEESKPDEPKVYSDEKVVLIVDDEKEIREYIGSELKLHFAVEYAENGVEALKIANKIVPDLILTDILMPEMDGNELCERIRSNENTSHIPIIALTALKNTEHELKALTKGADDFLSKPVSTKVLRQKIFNAIQSREALQHNYRKSLEITKSDPKQDTKGSADDQFIEKVKLLVEEHLEDPFFDVENLSAELGMSRMTLYRKIKAITGDSPSSLIRDVRLKLAAKLLLENELNVSEIADRVGYHDLSHFSGSFKKYYSCSPSQYLRNYKAQKKK